MTSGTTLDRVLIALAGLMGALAVAMGAWAAHGAAAAESAATGAIYQLVHVLAVLAALGLARAGAPPRTARAAAVLFAAGAVLFPGALYAAALGGPSWLGAAAPVGGTAFLLGWLALAAAGLGLRRGPRGTPPPHEDLGDRPDSS